MYVVYVSISVDLIDTLFNHSSALVSRLCTDYPYTSGKHLPSLLRGTPSNSLLFAHFLFPGNSIFSNFPSQSSSHFFKWPYHISLDNLTFCPLSMSSDVLIPNLVLVITTYRLGLSFLLLLAASPVSCSRIYRYAEY